MMQDGHSVTKTPLFTRETIWRARNRLPSQKWMVVVVTDAQSRPLRGGYCMRIRSLLGASVALAMTFAGANAQAQWFPLPSGPMSYYIGVEGGYTGVDDASGRIVGTGLRLKERFDDGYNAGGRVGVEWGPWRFEEEFRFQHNTQRSASISGLPAALCGGVAGCTATGRGTGDRRAYAIMTNAIYDFAPLTWAWGISPHIGGGIGAVGQHEGLRPIGLNEIVQNTQWEFGYQAIAGIRYNFSPNIVFDLDYRYLGTVDPTFRTVGGFKYESEYSSHNLVASLSYRFSPPPPPVVAPPPQPVAYPPPPPPPPAVPRVRG